ncbi:MAG: threonine-phosphate decarboxylase [Halomonas sp.]|jgi:threonine-phosphate decarboxylase|uniref:threonine-phosphate decarboxylase CobD n=1 Tax=Halomonas sp. 15WGF TaxID=2570357 RepID=UPI0010BF0F48|nr:MULTISPECIES: threonine-phosphate decarboxylase CobD [unclassified Halomonas]NQY77451.1 threonine-phosphate decarboxylase [Halomonas sp.]TKJ10680.1 threonine-phosphate decarboxylase [Halomonas sp. 15WGF]
MRDQPGNLPLHHWPSHGGQAAALLQRFGLPADHPLEDISANLNPLGPPGWVTGYLAQRLAGLGRYPEPDYRAARQAIAEHAGVEPGQVLLTNGGAEAIFLAAAHHAGQQALIVTPTFGEYARACNAHGVRISELGLLPGTFDPPAAALLQAAASADVVFVCRPNNPTGTLLPVALIEALLGALKPGASLVVDEAFIDLALEAAPLTPLLQRYPALILLRSMTKFFTLPGLRLGYVLADEGRIAQLQAQQPPWSVNHLAAELVPPLLADEDFARRTHQWLAREQPRMGAALAALGLEVVPSHSCFHLVRPGATQRQRGISSIVLLERLLHQGMLARHTHGFAGLKGGWLRLALRDGVTNDRLLKVLNDCLC